MHPVHDIVMTPMLAPGGGTHKLFVYTEGRNLATAELLLGK